MTEAHDHMLRYSASSPGYPEYPSDGAALKPQLIVIILVADLIFCIGLCMIVWWFTRNAAALAPLLLVGA